MKAAILQCDQVMDIFRPAFADYSEMIQGMFDAVDVDIDFDIFDCQTGDYPESMDHYDFFITTGSRAGVYEDKPWINLLIKYVKKLHLAQKKLIGICFGHQIIAIAMGGSVEKSGKGWGIGIANNPIIHTPSWMQPSKDILNMIVSHQDQVTVLPDKAQVIAESTFCPYFFVQWSNHFISVQGHPEWQTSYSEALINHRRNIIPADTVAAGLNTLDQQPDNKLFTQWIMQFIRYPGPTH